MARSWGPVGPVRVGDLLKASVASVGLRANGGRSPPVAPRVCPCTGQGPLPPLAAPSRRPRRAWELTMPQELETYSLSGADGIVWPISGRQKDGRTTKAPDRPQPALSLPFQDHHDHHRRVRHPGPITETAPRPSHRVNTGPGGCSRDTPSASARARAPGGRGPGGGEGPRAGRPSPTPRGPPSVPRARPLPSLRRPTARTPAAAGTPGETLTAEEPKNQSRLTAPRTRPAPAARSRAPRPARTRTASPRRRAPLPTLSSPLPVPATQCAGASASASPPLRRRRAPPTAVGHIEAGGGGRSSVASSPLPRWRLVPVSPQFLPYELGFLTLIRVEQVM